MGLEGGRGKDPFSNRSSLINSAIRSPNILRAIICASLFEKTMAQKPFTWSSMDLACFTISVGSWRKVSRSSVEYSLFWWEFPARVMNQTPWVC
jgi:hypothetical protein